MFDYWFVLKYCIEKVVNEEYFDGIVIIYGIDMFEEIVYFFDLVFNINVLIVIIGVMRLSNEFGLDGLINL